MKKLKTFLWLLPIALWSAGQGTPTHTKIGMKKGNDVLLVYTGGLTGMMDISIGVHIEIDSSIGVRYEVVYERGSSVMTHNATFYKFSNPDSSVFYNFLTHKSFVHFLSPVSGGNSKVTVVGTETIDSFTCTHLRHVSNGTTDYWMSKQVPGYQKLVNALENISPGLSELPFNGTLFTWGGLVKMRASFTDSKGRTMIGNLQITEANPGMSFPASDFDVPSN